MTEHYRDGDIIQSEIAGLSDIVIGEEYTGYLTTANEVLRMITLNNGYLNGQIWETDTHRYLIKKLLGKAYEAVLAGDTVKADLYLSMDYWNPICVSTMMESAEKFKAKNEMQTYNYIMHMSQYANTTFRCKALYAVIWHKHIGLLEYVLQKINPCNISDDDFKAACLNGLGKYIIKKNPVKFYMLKERYQNKRVIIETPKIRTEQEIKMYLMQQESNYKALAIYKYSNRTKENNILTGLPIELMRFIITMV